MKGRIRSLQKACAYCGAIFHPHLGKRDKQLTCSRSCGSKRSEAAKRFNVEQMMAHIKQNVTVTPSGCWEWMRAVDTAGYGFCRKWNGNKACHRVAYDLFKGPIGELDVLHACDNPPCCNPDHLFLGTAKDNIQDMMTKGRMRTLRGEELSCARLTEEAVRAIYFSSMSNGAAARAYGVSIDNIRMIRKGKTWKHLGLTGRAPDAPIVRNKLVDGVAYRLCADCNHWKLAEEFSFAKRGVRYSYCRPCAARQQKERTARLRMIAA